MNKKINITIFSLMFVLCSSAFPQLNSDQLSFSKQRLLISSEAASAKKANSVPLSGLREASIWLGSVGLIMIGDALPEADLNGCAPCAKSEVPFFDRWTIHDENIGWQVTGWTGLAAFGFYSWQDLWRNQPNGFSHFRASFESGLTAVGFSVLFKEIFHRRRPIFYTDKILEEDEAGLREAFRSMPSGDTAFAFSIATSYLLSKGNKANKTQRYFALGAASWSGISRIAGGKHFPSDVLAGAALGVGCAYLVHWVRGL